MLLNMNHIYLPFIWTLINSAWGTYPMYGNYKRIDADFIPSDPGKTPSCVRDPRLTYCIKPKRYPEDRIVYLLKNKMFDLDTLLQDETRDTYTFEGRDGMVIPTTMMYGPVQPTRSYSRPKKGYKSSYGSSYSNKRNSSHSNGSWMPKSSSYNSFTPTNPTKYDEYESGRSYQNYATESYYTRHQKNGNSKMGAGYNSSPEQRYWWKNSSRRQKRQINFDELCPSRSNYIMPRAAQSVEGDWMFLVNVGDQYRQLVKSETCIRNTCEGSCDAPEGFSAICQQQYVQKRLVALDGSGTKLNSDTFWFPSCCQCKVRPIES